MNFTYEDYNRILKLLKEKNYCNCNYSMTKEGSFILRHDIDYEPEKSIRIAEIEKENDVHSIFFFLLTSDFYNILSKNNIRIIKSICNMGHSIGLHFDELNYPDLVGKAESIKKAITNEITIMENNLGIPVDVFSYHRPSKEILLANLSVPGKINSYSDVFFKEYKYLSDSRRVWREPVEEIIEDKKYNKLHILTHPFWYNENEISLGASITSFIEQASKDRYNCLDENFTNLSDALGEIII